MLDRQRAQLGIFMVLVLGAVALVVVTVTLLLGITIVGQTAADLGGQASPINKTAEPDPVTGSAISFEDTSGPATINEVFDVRDSRGYGVQLTGADDSYIQSTGNFDIATDSTWTVSTWTKVNSSATGENMTIVSGNGRVLLQYLGNQSTPKWSAWYYDEGARNSYRVNITASDQTNFTWVAAWYNGSHLTVYENTTRGEIVNVSSTSGIKDSTLNSTNLHGVLDETRTFDDALNSSERSERVNSPILPAKNTNRTARIMYDQGKGSDTPIYFTNTKATLSNATWVDGLSGQTLTDGVDYTIDKGAGTITALASGDIDGAPVVFIDYEYQAVDDVVKTSRAMQGAYRLFGQSVLAIPAAAILAVLVGGLVGAIQMGTIPGTRNGGNR